MSTNAIKKIILPSSFILTSLIIWRLCELIFGCPGQIVRPWALEKIKEIKQTEHFIYWFVMISIPLISISIGRLIQAWLKDKPDPEMAEADPSLTPVSSKTLRIFYWIVLPVLIFCLAPRTPAHISVDKMVEGHHLSVTNKINHGLKSYKDIFFIYGPLMEIYQTKLGIFLFGDSLEGVRKMNWFVEPMGLMAAVLLLLVLLRKKYLLLLLLIPAFDRGQIHVRMAFPLLSFLFFIVGWQGRTYVHRKFMYMISGFLCVIAFFYSIESGPLAAFSILLFVGINYLKGSIYKTTVSEEKAALKYFIFGTAVVGLPVVIWLFATGRLMILFENIILMKHIFITSQAKPTPLLCEPIREFVQNPFIVFSTEGVWVRWWFPALFFIGYSTWALNNNLSKKEFDGKNGYLLLVIAGILFFYITLGRTDFDHWMKGTALFWILAVVLIDQTLNRNIWRIKNWSGQITRTISLLITFGVILGFGRVSFALQYLKGPYWLTQFNKMSQPEALRRLGGIKIPADEKQIIKETVEEIWNHSAKGQPVYIFSTEPIYYYFADVINPTRYPHTILLATDKVVQEVISDLEKSKPKLIMVAGSKDNYIYDSIQKPLMNYILDNYSISIEKHHYVYFIRKNDA